MECVSDSFAGVRIDDHLLAPQLVTEWFALTIAKPPVANIPSRLLWSFHVICMDVNFSTGFHSPNGVRVLSDAPGRKTITADKHQLSSLRPCDITRIAHEP